MGHKLTEKQRLQQEELRAAGKDVDLNASQTQTSGSTDGTKNAAPESAGTVPADTTTGTATGTTTTTSAGSTSRTR